MPFDGDCCSTGCWAKAAPASTNEQPINKLVSFFIIIMFSRWRSAIYSSPPCDFPQPREAEAFTRHRSPTVLRAIAPIRFPVNPRRRGSKARADLQIKHQTSDIKSANGRIDLLALAALKLAPSPTRSLLPSQFHLLCRFPQKLHSASRLNPSMSLASLRLHSPWRTSARPARHTLLLRFKRSFCSSLASHRKSFG